MESSSSTPSVPKYDWYQTDAKVVISVLVKNVTPDNVKMNFTPENVSAFIKLPSNEDNSLNLNLSHTIVPEKSSFKVLPSKVEISLVKEAGCRWDTLERKVEVVNQPKVTAKNWDAVTKKLVDDKDDESIDSLFNKIYSDGNEDQKRAMLKSFYESNGTVLSTDWKEVGQKKVEIKPPEGVEYKSWKQ